MSYVNDKKRKVTASAKPKTSDSDGSQTQDKPTKLRENAAPTQSVGDRADKHSEDSDAKDEGSDSESDDESVAERKKMLAQGRLANFEQRKNADKRPKEIDDLWTALYPMVQNWWIKEGKAMNDHDESMLNEKQADIKRACLDIAYMDAKAAWEKENAKKPKDKQRVEEDLEKDCRRHCKKQIVPKLLEKWAFPAPTLHGFMEAAAAAIGRLKDLEEETIGEVSAEEEQKLSDERDKFLAGVATFVAGLAKYDIPAKSVISPAAFKMFDQVLHDSPGEARKRYEETMKYLNNPTEDQKKAWAESLPRIEEVIQVTQKSAMPTGQDEASLNKAIEVVAKKDQELQACNKKQNINLDDNSLPVGELSDLKTAWSNGNEEKVQSLLKVLAKFLKDRAPAVALLDKIKQAKEQTEKTEKTRPPIKQEPEEEETDATLPLKEQGKADRKSGSGSDGLFVSPDDDLAALREAALGNSNVIDVFDYNADGCTEYGIAVAIRISDNPRHSRIVVNAGTKNFEHHRLIKGSDLFPGGAEALSGEEMEGIHDDFDLREERRKLRTNKSHIKSVGPIVIADYGGGAKRRPEALVRILFADGSEKWPCRTQYTGLVGKTNSDRHMTQLEVAYVKRTAYTNECRRRRINPETGKRLSDTDREQYPWLFPDNGVAIQGSCRVRSKEERYEPELILNGAPKSD